MIRWCSYCCRFIEEIAPFEDLRVSHGICSACADRAPEAFSDQGGRIQRLVEVHRQMWSLGRAGESDQVPDLMGRLDALGVSRVDSLVGLLLPMLVEIGRLWEVGEISVLEEHRFSRFAEDLIAWVRTSRGRARAPGACRVLLTSVDGNQHVLGLKVLELVLEQSGVAAQVVVPGLPLAELCELVSTTRPQVVGLSVAIESQLPALRDALEALRALPVTGPSPRVVVGGHAITSGRLGTADLLGAEAFKGTPAALVAWLESTGEAALS